jgi:hypothetical protein
MSHQTPTTQKWTESKIFGNCVHDPSSITSSTDIIITIPAEIGLSGWKSTKASRNQPLCCRSVVSRASQAMSKPLKQKNDVPPFPLPDSTQTVNLMDRLQAFLPKLEAANQGTYIRADLHVYFCSSVRSIVSFLPSWATLFLCFLSFLFGQTITFVIK